MDKIQRAVSTLVLVSMLLGRLPPPLWAETEPELPPIASCAHAQAEAPAIEESSASIEADAGGKVELDGVSVELPPGAVKEATRISIRKLRSLEELGEDIANVTSGAPGYRFEPRGIRFERAVTIRVPFDRRLLSSEAGLSNLYTYFYDESSGRWERLERKGIDREAALVKSETTHFTDVINATLKLPEGPKPIRFDLNSIKNLEAADPGEEVPKPEGPEPNAFGSNSFAIPLRLPPGRGGAKPKLALRYSSETSNGWLGRGFDIEVPAVTIDTRFGLPKYGGNDLYSLGGEELERTSAPGPSTFYEPRVEKAFQRIRWLRTGGEDYWETTDKDGTVREYGRGEGWIGPSRSDRTRTFIWYLTKQKDAFGNTVSYDYGYDAPNAYTYLTAIRYSGRESDGATEAGLFRVDFARQDREDRRSEARGGFPSKLAQRLARIDVSVSGAPLRSFVFDYGESNEFGQSQLRSFSEKDGAATFYTYRFEYFALGAHPDGRAGPSYDGFGASADNLVCQNWNLGSEGKYDGLSSSMTASIGGSLSSGFRFYIPKIWRPGRKELAELSIHTGIGASIGGSTGTFLDANGDGLPDLVWRDSGSLYANLNTGSSFDSSAPFRLSGISSVMDVESSYNIGYGATARFSALGGGVSKQESWSSCESSFADLNGDGLADFVTLDDASHCFLNTGSGFDREPLGFGAAVATDAADKNDAVYQAMYYLEEPVRAWQAWRSGTVEVTMHDLKLLEPDRTGQVALYTYAPGGAADAVTLPGTGTGFDKQYALGQRDRLFFRVDTEGDERKAEVSWGIKVSYTSIKLFESLAEGFDYKPAKSGLLSEYQSWPGDLQYLYTASSISSETYLLDESWRSEADSRPGAYQALIKLGRFVPKKVSAKYFTLMLDAANAAADNQMQAPSGSEGSSQYQKLFLGYGYEPETGYFRRLSSADVIDADAKSFLASNQGAIDEAFMRYVAIDGISDTDRQAMSLVAAVDNDGGSVTVNIDSGGIAWYGRSASIGLDASILPSSCSAEATDGMQVEGKGFLLERRTNPSTNKLERLWLRGAGSTPHIYTEVEGEETEYTAASPYASSGADALSLNMSDYRVPRAFRFSVPSYLLASMPESLYEGILSDYVLAGKSFSTDSYWKLSAASYAAIDSGLSGDPPASTPPAAPPPSDKALFEASYALGADGSYELSAAIAQVELVRILALLQPQPASGSNPFFTLPGDTAMRLVRLGSDAFSAFLSAEGSDFGSDFALVGGAYCPRSELGADELSRLLTAMRRYCCDVRLFPYYAHDAAGGIWQLKTPPASLNVDQKNSIAATLQGCGLYAYTTLTKTIEYRSDQVLDVKQVKLPAGASVAAIAPNGGRAESAGADVGLAIVPVLGSGGAATLRPRYLHDYDSSSDYSNVDLSAYDPKALGGEGSQPQTTCFQGGVYGWYYGLWTGNYAWDASKLGTAPDESGKDFDDGDVANPPYSSEVKANAQSDGSKLIALSGRDTRVAVPSEAWVGGVSSYGASSISEDMKPTTTTYNFAAFMDGLNWYPSRNGGDSYYRIPNKDGEIGSGGSLSFIRESHSSGKDWNLPAGISHNTSKSWQYCGLLDLNGDRYPDLLKFRDSSGGASSFTVVSGKGQGFGSGDRYNLPFSGYLSRSLTETYTMGASPSAAIGAVNVLFGSGGKPKAAIPQQDGAGTNIDFTAAFGSSVQTDGFYDLNGDGLPDYVSRGGTGSYGVAINCGDGNFRSVDWGLNRVSANAFDGISGLGSIALQGISHTSVGSFGASIGGGGTPRVNLSLSGSANQTISSLFDVNGDGLPDIVVKKPDEDFFRVRFNQGDKFADAETRIHRPEWPSDVDNYKFDAARELQQILGGLNGIGVLGHDVSGYVGDMGSISIPSLGENPFSALNPFQIDDDLEYSTGANLGIGANINLEYGWYFLDWFIQPGINGSVARTSVDLKFTDIDGDGLPDHLLKMPCSSAVYVKRNLMGEAGLLKTLRLPQGGSYAFEYKRTQNSSDLPQRRWVLQSLTKDDGSSGAYADRGAHAYTETFDYAGGYYDRSERMFYGFAKLSATKGDGSVAITEYSNRKYYERGLATRTELEGPDAQGRQAIYQETIFAWTPNPIQGSQGKAIHFPALSTETKRQYEAGSLRYVETGVSYDYGAYGNVKTFTDCGLTGDASDDLTAVIQYDDTLPGYLKQQPKSIEVRDAGGKLLRRRTGSYGDSGELTGLAEYDSDASFREHKLAYDDYGNFASITDPRGYCVSWAYEGVDRAYPTLFTRGNADPGLPTYTSRATWDAGLGKKSSETDENGQTMRYYYDDFGRLKEVRSPYDTGSVPAVAHSYDIASFPWSAATENKLLYDAGDKQKMQTIVAIDGLGRVLQTAKQGEYRDSEGNRHYGWNLSGAIAYDAKARQAAEGQPQFAEGSSAPAIGAMLKPSATSYDAADRIVKKLFPDGATMTTEYLVENSLPLERSVDPLLNASEKRSDGRGNVSSLRRLSTTGAVLMSASYVYNGLGEMLSATDSKGNTVSLTYNLSGKRTSLESPDTGKLLLSYDEAGNLAKKTDAVLRSRGEAVTYAYDGLERLVKVNYPRTTATEYVFGAAGAGKGGAGRLVERRDASGTVDYEYGLLGETAAMSRSIDRLTPLADKLPARLEYRSDYLGRMQRISYPDGEVLSYGYDSGGQLSSATSEHNGLTTTYVADIAYDAFGQRRYIEYGNGVRTSYAYDENRRWLSSIDTKSGLGTTYQAMSYSFDLAGNVLGYANAASGYETSQSYGYDGLYQLTSAQGTSIYHPLGLAEYKSDYTQSFAYDAIGNMESKKSSCATNPSRSVGEDLNYEYAYSYYAGKAHQAEIIGNRYYRYDANGNMTEEREGGHGTGEALAGTLYKSGDLRMTDTGFGIVRQGSAQSGSGKAVYCRSYAWDEENRLIRSADNDIAVDYRYGADGQRAAKCAPNGESMYFDPMWAVQTDGPSFRQMKNVYIGQTRIATRLTLSGERTTGYEKQNTYYYHPDHLGSAQLVTDYQGNEYERIEYTPYGESWIERTRDGLELLPYKFTGKELDSETGLYYYGARYLNPRTGAWISADPALADYIPVAPVDEEARKHNEKLPGMGGVYNPMNLALYHYAGNNPVKYTDPDGKIDWISSSLQATNNDYGADHYRDALSSLLNENIGDAAAYAFCGAVEGVTDNMNAVIANRIGLNPVGLMNAGIKAISVVATPYGPAVQSDAPAALDARASVIGGATLYRIGTMGKSDAGEAQFWSLENPLTPGYAERNGIPPENVKKADFIETATLKPGSSFVTRKAPGCGTNPGGGIEVVVPRGAIDVKSFTILPQD
jgi:RHS repeat-associated protein